MADKVSFNGDAKLITVLPGVTNLDIRTDVYSRWVDWRALSGNDIFWEAFRRTGFDTIPGGFSGDMYFLINGWKLIIDFRQTRVTGILFSDDYETPYYTSLLEPLYPAKVSALVNNIVTAGTPVVTGDLSTVGNLVWNHLSRTLTQDAAPTAQEVAIAVENQLSDDFGNITVDNTAIANAVFSKAIQGMAFSKIIEIFLAALSGKTSGTNTNMTYYATDGITPVLTVTTSNNNRTAITIHI